MEPLTGHPIFAPPRVERKSRSEDITEEVERDRRLRERAEQRRVIDQNEASNNEAVFSATPQNNRPRRPSETEYQVVSTTGVDRSDTRETTSGRTIRRTAGKRDIEIRPKLTQAVRETKDVREFRGDQEDTPLPEDIDTHRELPEPIAAAGNRERDDGSEAEPAGRGSGIERKNTGGESIVRTIPPRPRSTRERTSGDESHGSSVEKRSSVSTEGDDGVIGGQAEILTKPVSDTAGKSILNIECQVAGGSPATPSETSGSGTEAENIVPTQSVDIMAASNGVRLPSMKMPTYSGGTNENYERFFDEMNIMKEINKWDDAIFLNIVKFHIKGGAATWMKSIPNTDQDTLEKVRNILKETFGDKRPAWLRHRDLNNLRQEKNEEVTSFALRVKTYMRPKMEDGEFISVFVSGLHRSIGNELAKAELKTFKDAVGMAVRLESVEKKHPEKKGDLLLLERGPEVRTPGGYDSDPEFIQIVENYFMGTAMPAQNPNYAPLQAGPASALQPTIRLPWPGPIDPRHPPMELQGEEAAPGEEADSPDKVIITIECRDRLVDEEAA